MKLRDTDYLYATMRVRVNEKSLLTAQKIERMCDARTAEEAGKILSESGYGDFAVSSFSEVERAICAMRADTMKLIAEICQNTYIAEVFALKYDFHNIKTVIKAELTSSDPERLLSDSSLIPKDELLRAVRAEDMSALPEKMAAAFSEARDTLAHTGDPQLADFILDNACFAMMADAAKASQSEFLQGYVSLMADAANLRTAVRACRQGRGAEVLGACLVSGGSIDKNVFLTFDFESGFSATSLAAAAELGAAAAKGDTGLLEFERELDNALIKYMQSAKYVAFDERPIIAYIAAKESEAMAVRIIMAGKLEGLSCDEIRSRLRINHV